MGYKKEERDVARKKAGEQCEVKMEEEECDGGGLGAWRWGGNLTEVEVC